MPEENIKEENLNNENTEPLTHAERERQAVKSFLGVMGTFFLVTGLALGFAFATTLLLGYIASYIVSVEAGVMVNTIFFALGFMFFFTAFAITYSVYEKLTTKLIALYTVSYIIFGSLFIFLGKDLLN